MEGCLTGYYSTKKDLEVDNPEVAFRKIQNSEKHERENTMSRAGTVDGEIVERDPYLTNLLINSCSLYYISLNSTRKCWKILN